MSLEELDFDRTMETRRKAVEANIKRMSVEELKALGEKIFPFHDHPWREPFFDFIEENAGAAFYHATVDEHVEIVYCAQKDKGIWYKPGNGMGPLQTIGLAVLKKIVEKR